MASRSSVWSCCSRVELFCVELFSRFCRVLLPCCCAVIVVLYLCVVCCKSNKSEFRKFCCFFEMSNQIYVCVCICCETSQQASLVPFFFGRILVDPTSDSDSPCNFDPFLHRSQPTWTDVRSFPASKKTRVIFSSVTIAIKQVKNPV